MHRGKFGELYFKQLPRFSCEVMIPALFAQTTKDIIRYIEEHFNVVNQKILKKEFENDKRQIW